MSEIVIPYSPRKLQKFLHTQIPKSRFNVIVAHRRSGKTVMCINHMIRDALTNTQPNPRYAFISPTFKQGKVQHGITSKILPRIFHLLNSMNQNLDVIFLMAQE